MITQEGIDLIKSFESCRLQAYKDPAGVLTIGWGHTRDVKEGQVITQAEADAYLHNDIAAAEAKVQKWGHRYSWNKNELAALTSFAYNIGTIDQLTADGTRDRKTISEKMLLYVNAGGKRLEGLVRRRKAEQELFLKPARLPIQEERIRELLTQLPAIYTLLNDLRLTIECAMDDIEEHI